MFLGTTRWEEQEKAELYEVEQARRAAKAREKAEEGERLRIEWEKDRSDTKPSSACTCIFGLQDDASLSGVFRVHDLGLGILQFCD